MDRERRKALRLDHVRGSDGGARGGGYNALSGIAALSDDDAIASQAKEVLYGIDLTAWGWFWRLVGLAQIVTGVLNLPAQHMGALARRRLRGPELRC